MTTVLFCAPTVGWRYDGELEALAGAQVVVANHEGMLDILAVCSMPGTRTLLAKTWVFRAFPLGLAARAAGLRNSDLLEADDYRGNAALTTSARDGAGILVFPEGRRSRTGAVHRFRPGAFVLASSLGAPVVPMAIAGSRQGIRPDGMWIHPTILHCRVLAPMRQQADESHRQVAERCRLAIAAARCALMREHVATPRMIANRLHHFTGLGGELARAIRTEQREGGWRWMAAVCGEDDLPWLFLGCGWSTLAVTLRQLLPTPAIIAIDRDAEHRAVASCAWFHPGHDHLLADADVALLPERVAGVVCLLRHDDRIVQALWPVLAGRIAGAALVPVGDVSHWQALDGMGSREADAAGPGAGLVALRPRRSS
jgi:1-acyl-sn-glycerol-3-phosphate acyltransferase